MPDSADVLSPAAPAPIPKVSVCVTTYNHEFYIAQAIESVLMQSTTFDVEVVIGEDCSQDGTRDLLLECQKQFPDRIRLLLHPENVGPQRNFLLTLKECRGQYVALLDGDDYWIDPHKLQKQVDCLDSRQESVGCAHNALQISGDPPVPIRLQNRRSKAMYSAEDLIMSDPFATGALMIRRSATADLPPWFSTLTSGDWVLIYWTSRLGPYIYLNEVMSAYRVHPAGVWSGRSRLLQLRTILEVLAAFELHSTAPLAERARMATAGCLLEAAAEHAAQGQYRPGWRSLARAFAVSRGVPPGGMREVATVALCLAVPGFVRLLRLRRARQRTNCRAEDPPRDPHSPEL